MKTGIIFDMDGTLWDSSANVAASWNEILRERGIARAPLTQQDMQSIMGMTMTAIADRLWSMVPAPARYELMHTCELHENEYLLEHGGELYPELTSTLTVLMERGYHLYIVSNCQSGYIETFLEHYHMEDFFEDLECYGNTQKGKADNIRALALRNSLDRYYYVGDIQADYDAAISGGAEFIHAAYGFGTVAQEVPRIREFAELKKLFA